MRNVHLLSPELEMVRNVQLLSPELKMVRNVQLLSPELKIQPFAMMGRIVYGRLAPRRHRAQGYNEPQRHGDVRVDGDGGCRLQEKLRPPFVLT